MKKRCVLMTDPLARDEANRRTASIREAMPAGLAQPALRALVLAGIHSLEQLAERREDDLLALHGMGPRAMAILRAALAARGLGFKE